MTLRKHGTGEILRPDDDVLIKHASSGEVLQPDWSEQDSADLAAENAQADVED